MNHQLPGTVLMTSDTVGGVWTYSLELARALRSYGVEVALATMGPRPSWEQSVEAARISNLTLFESEFKLEWMPQPWDDVDAAAEWLTELAARTGAQLVHLNGFCHGALPFTCPKVVVGHSCVCSWWGAVKRNVLPEAWQEYRRRVRTGLQSADLVIAPSLAMMRSLKAHYGPLSSCRVIPNGQALRVATEVRKENLVLAAGRLWDEAKNVSALHAIAAKLSWPVCVAGDRDPKVAEADNFRCLGRLSSGELWNWFERASIYALPAKYEPFGLSVLEAATAGCALVLGNIDSLREIWGDAAVFVDPEDPEALCAAISSLISRPGKRFELGRRARARAVLFTSDRMASGYANAYRDLIALHAPLLAA